MENRSAWKVTVVALAAVAICFPTHLGSGNHQEAMSSQRCLVAEQSLRTGDIVARARPDLISKLVRAWQGDDRYSHVGIAVVRAGRVEVFHADLDLENSVDGVISEDICSFLSGASRAIALRFLKSLSDSEQNEVKTAVFGMRSTRFNKTLQWESPVGEVYCTQYLWRIFTAALPSRAIPSRAGKVLTVPQIIDGWPLRVVHYLPM